MKKEINDEKLLKTIGFLPIISLGACAVLSTIIGNTGYELGYFLIDKTSTLALVIGVLNYKNQWSHLIIFGAIFCQLLSLLFHPIT